MKESARNMQRACLVECTGLGSEARMHGIGFNDLLIDCVNEAFAEVLGVKITEALWQHYQLSLGMVREEIPYHLPKLFDSIENIFGTGYESVGERVIKRVYAKADVPLKYSEKRPLLEYAEELKQILGNDVKLAEAKEHARKPLFLPHPSLDTYPTNLTATET